MLQIAEKYTAEHAVLNIDEYYFKRKDGKYVQKLFTPRQFKDCNNAKFNVVAPQLKYLYLLGDGKTEQLGKGTFKQCGSRWWHYLGSVWIVRTDLTPAQCYERLRPNIDDNDYLFVVDISRQQRQGWLPTDAWEWIKTNDV